MHNTLGVNNSTIAITVIAIFVGAVVVVDFAVSFLKRNPLTVVQK
jgi:hypothetical protein